MDSRRRLAHIEREIMKRAALVEPRGICEFCEGEVFPWQSAGHRIRGWEIERTGGGANRIAGKERQSGRIVHASCLERHLKIEKQGLRGQMDLYEVLAESGNA
jgi:hypothetical protein